MGEQALSAPKKKILYVGLFIAPFLLAMALIFMGKNLGTLPVLGEDGKTYLQLKRKNPPAYYVVPEFELTDFEGNQVQFRHADSILYLLTILPKSKPEEWSKHVLYVGEKIVPRCTNVRVISLFEGSAEDNLWEEDPIPYIKTKSDKWSLSYVNEIQYNEFLSKFKTAVNDSTGIPPYILVDKDEHIRAHCTINDAKISRDIPKMFKLLSNQYVSGKLDIKQVK
jgi:hypothetical protein